LNWLYGRVGAEIGLVTGGPGIGAVSRNTTISEIPVAKASRPAPKYLPLSVLSGLGICPGRGQTTACANTRFSERAVRIAHETVSTIAAMVMLKHATVFTNT
jgi:hypothetical protein